MAVAPPAPTAALIYDLGVLHAASATSPMVDGASGVRVSWRLAAGKSSASLGPVNKTLRTWRASPPRVVVRNYSNHPIRADVPGPPYVGSLTCLIEASAFGVPASPPASTTVRTSFGKAMTATWSTPRSSRTATDWEPAGRTRLNPIYERALGATADLPGPNGSVIRALDDS